MPATDTSQENSQLRGLSDQQSARIKYAIKTALALTLAYLTPMALGWPQPQTAAITVMLIAATGLTSESLQKGVLRIMGTLAGAIIGLSLIALFPQDRVVYLLFTSMAVAVSLYLYNAYQGDGTVFMLSAVVIMMVFNGGDAEGAFLYGVDRTLLTVHGVIVYTLVASLLWPVKRKDSTANSAVSLTAGYRQALQQISSPIDASSQQNRDFLAGLLHDDEQFFAELAAVDGNSELKAGYRQEWQLIAAGYASLRESLPAALQTRGGENIQFNYYLVNHDALLAQIDALFRQIESAWQGSGTGTAPTPLESGYRPDLLVNESHMVIAAIAARAELLQQTQQTLIEMLAAIGNLLYDGANKLPTRATDSPPAFVWWDIENFKTAVRAFVTFWLATAIWLAFNPPGGFMFVTMCTALIPLVSYTPVTPKLLIILFTLGFVFALPAYVFLLPHMTHWMELSLFLFAYAFVGFFVFQGPVSIFFLLGLFTLGIQNEMSYNVNVILLVILMFYMVCALQIISIHFPFTSKAEQIYPDISRRFFSHCAHFLRRRKSVKGLSGSALRRNSGVGARLIEKLNIWGSRIDASQFPSANPEKIAAFNQSCELLQAQLDELAAQDHLESDNSLLRALGGRLRGSPLADLCDMLSNNNCNGPSDPAFVRVQNDLETLRVGLDQIPPQSLLDTYTPAELSRFYRVLNLQVAILRQLDICRESQQQLDWQQLEGRRF